MTVNDLILHLGLEPHPEGGYYKETYRAEGQIGRSALQGRFNGDRAYATAIYFMLECGEFSAFHRIQSDECWHFYQGVPLHVYVLEPSGRCRTILLGNRPDRGETFQAVVPAGRWFASRPVETDAGAPPDGPGSTAAATSVGSPGSLVAATLPDGPGTRGYSLVCCTVAPGFDFADFEMAQAAALIAEYPQHAALIRSLCR
jgi:uncharacterized protein